MLDTPSSALPAPPDLADTVIRLLDEFEAADFRSAERVLTAMRRLGRTGPGFPRARPGDCERVTKSLQHAFAANLPAFRSGDREIVRRFEAILEAFTQTDIRFYPRELLRVRVLQAEARLIMSNPAGARALVGAFADRPYKIEGEYQDFARLMEFDCRARVAAGEIADLRQVAAKRARLLGRLWPRQLYWIASDFVPFLSLGRMPRGEGWLAAAIFLAARAAAKARIRPGTIGQAIVRFVTSRIGVVCVALLLLASQLAEVFKGRRAGAVAVTRAMGGIGDLFMMTAGLRALSHRRGTRIQLVIDRKFFDIFRNNPDVELFDIEGDPGVVDSAGYWYNLTRCPAARYESRRRPAVRKGRTELFARGMGIRKYQLLQSGFGLAYTLDGDQRAFARRFLAEAGLGARAIIGVQPYSRDSYKDHAEIGAVIERLREHYDVLLFHHVDEGLPAGPGTASTAGLLLAQSIALVAHVDALVTIDSGFLHAAAAFDIPVVALFGPTDGRLFTRHHKNVVLLQPRERFPCSPCWRNEDMACQLTGLVGPSPCVAAISPQEIEAAVAQALKMNAAGPARLAAAE